MITAIETVLVCGCVHKCFRKNSPSVLPPQVDKPKVSDTGEVFKPAEVLCQGSETNTIDFRLSNIIFLFGLNEFSRFFFYMENTHMTTSECGGREGAGRDGAERNSLVIETARELESHPGTIKGGQRG